MWSWRRWPPTDRNMNGEAGNWTSEHSVSFPCPHHPVLMGFLLLSFPPLKPFHLASLRSCSSHALSSHLSPSSILYIPTYLCLDNSSLSQRAWDGQQCILPSLSWLNSLIIFLLLLCPVDFILLESSVCVCIYVHIHTHMHCVFTQWPAPGNCILSQCCDQRKYDQDSLPCWADTCG